MSQRQHTAIIELSNSDTISYQYMCRDGDTSPPLATFRNDCRLEGIRNSVASLMQVLQCTRLSPDRADDLKQWGGRLYDALIPEVLGESLQSEQPGESTLSIYLDPAIAWIPWELLWDGDEFLCRRFQLGRLLQKSGSELRAANERLRGRRSGRGALIVFGSTQNLDASGEKSAVVEELREVYGATNVWFYSARGAVDILDELKKYYEICHFIGHGQFDRESPERSGWSFADGSVLDCRSIGRVSSRASFPYLVFANSCFSARPNLADAHEYVASLYRAFLNQGVPHYIGTIVPVPDAPSKVFALNFYKLLANGLSIGEALSRTRRAFADATEFGIWSSYVHYGDPTYRLLAAGCGEGRIRGEAARRVVCGAGVYWYAAVDARRARRACSTQARSRARSRRAPSVDACRDLQVRPAKRRGLRARHHAAHRRGAPDTRSPRVVSHCPWCSRPFHFGREQ
jgi:CHAT domain-containing protein